MSSHFFTRVEIQRLLNGAIGKTLGEVDINNVFERAILHPKITGIAGDVIEQSVLGFRASSSSDPDLNVDGVLTELKTTGIRLKNKEYEAKEPMTLTAVSIGSIQNEENFEVGHLWYKCGHLLIVFYHYKSETIVKALGYMEFPIKGFTFYEFNPEDRLKLENDWTTIRDFIRYLDTLPNPQEEYPRLSSELRGELMILDTAPKYPKSPRFRLKRDFVSTIVQDYFNKKSASLDKSYTSFKELDSKCRELRQSYGNMSVATIAEKFDVSVPKTKSTSEYLVVRMMGGNVKKLNSIDLFRKASIYAKSVTLNRSGGRTEDMKLFSIDFEEIEDTSISFEDSSFYDYFYSRHFLFPIFKEPYDDCKLSENVFQGFKRLMLPEDFIHTQAKLLFDEIRHLVMDNELRDVPVFNKEGNQIINKNGVPRSAPNFPKSADENGLSLFVRGSGEDSSKKPLCVNGVDMYEQWVWIRGDEIIKELEKHPYI